MSPQVDLESIKSLSFGFCTTVEDCIALTTAEATAEHHAFAFLLSTFEPAMNRDRHTPSLRELITPTSFVAVPIPTTSGPGQSYDVDQPCGNPALGVAVRLESRS